MRERQKERKADTRGKILADAAVLNEAEQRPDKAALLKLLDRFLTRPDDRALFNLPTQLPDRPDNGTSGRIHAHQPGSRRSASGFDEGRRQPRPANRGSLRGPGTLARAQTSSSTITSRSPGTARTRTAPCSARSRTTGRLEKALSPDAVYKIVRRYSADLGFEIGAHALRATAATNAPTRIYAHRKTRPEDSPTFKVDYR